MSSGGNLLAQEDMPVNENSNNNILRQTIVNSQMDTLNSVRG